MEDEDNQNGVVFLNKSFLTFFYMGLNIGITQHDPFKAYQRMKESKTNLITK